MKIRFRYNTLFFLSVFTITCIVILDIKIKTLENKLEKYAKVNDIKARATYINHNVGQIDRLAHDAHSLAEAAYDMAFGKESKSKWMEGLTTDEIDSIRSIQ